MASLTIFKYLPRTIRLTREGIHFVLLAIGVGFAAINTGANLLYLLVAMMLSVIIVSGLLSEQSLRKVSASVGAIPPLVAGLQASIPVTLRNDKRRFSSFSLAVTPVWSGPPAEQAPYFRRLSSREERTDILRATFPKRGLYWMEGVKLSTLFPFGLFLKAAAREAPTEIWVYPALRPIEWSLLSTLEEAVFSSERKGEGAGFNQFRNYLPGDDSRLIHWKVSARQGRLIVKERELEEDREVVLFFNNLAPKTKRPDWDDLFERGVETTASLATAMSEAGLKVGLQTAEQSIPPDAGPHQLDLLLKALATLKAVSDVDASLTSLSIDGIAWRTPGSPPMIWIRLEGDSSWKGTEFEWEEVIDVQRGDKRGEQENVIR